MQHSLPGKLGMIPAIMLALMTGGRTSAQVCVPGHMLLEHDAGSYAPRGIERIDAVDAVVWGGDHPTAPAVLTSDPATRSAAAL